MKALIIATLFASLLACSPSQVSSTTPSPVAADSFNFVVQPGSHGQYVENPSVSAKGSEGNITIQAQLSTPDPCHQIEGTAERNGNQVTMHVAIRPSENGCIAILGNFSYEATISDLPPDTYQVEVIHEYPNRDSSSETRFNQTVEVS